MKEDRNEGRPECTTVEVAGSIPATDKNYCSHNIAEFLPIRVVGSSPTIKSQSDYPWGLVQLRDRCFG